MIDERAFPSSPASIKRAREFVAQHFVETSAADAARLMMSELATNCVRHAGSGFTVTITGDTSTSLRVDIRDHGEGGVQPRLRDPDATEPTGRGLRIVDSLADDWGTSINDTGGHTVWFTLSFQAPVLALGDNQTDARTALDDTQAPSPQAAFVSGAGPPKARYPAAKSTCCCSRSLTAHGISVPRHTASSGR